jgi:hypothetical protein
MVDNRESTTWQDYEALANRAETGGDIRRFFIQGGSIAKTLIRVKRSATKFTTGATGREWYLEADESSRQLFAPSFASSRRRVSRLSTCGAKGSLLRAAPPGFTI